MYQSKNILMLIKIHFKITVILRLGRLGVGILHQTYEGGGGKKIHQNKSCL